MTITDLSNCSICPQNCGADRINGSSGKCKSGAEMKIASYGPHFGEEPELVGTGGSGTIFFSSCNLFCIFCQNYDISHYNEGFIIDENQLANIMFGLEQKGCTNINFVTPTHFTLQIIKSIEIARTGGLKIPIVWNSNGYEKSETIKMLEGLVDIYMPDLKFIKPEKSKRLTIADDYFKYASETITEMHRQVGNLVIKNRIAKRGLILRHLILPDNQSDTKEIIDFVYEKFGADTYLNLMEQYYPCYNSFKHEVINRRITYKEYRKYIEYALLKGFHRPEHIFNQKI